MVAAYLTVPFVSLMTPSMYSRLRLGYSTVKFFAYKEIQHIEVA